MSKKRPPTLKKFWYIQDWGTYQNETAVFVGYTREEIGVALKKDKCNKELIASWEKDNKGVKNEFADTAQGFFSFVDGRSIMSFPDFDDDWRNLETLVHECVHAVLNILGAHKAFIVARDSFEDEGIAYQVEFLFRSIRKKLQDEYWRKDRKA